VNRRTEVVDLSEFDDAAIKKAGGTGLKLDAVLSELPPDKAAKLRAALLAHYKPAAIVKVLGDWGHKVSDSSIRNWRERYDGDRV
jgi:hypothetical protein